MNLPALLIALLIQFCAALAFFPAMQWGDAPRLRRWAAFVAFVIILATPHVLGSVVGAAIPGRWASALQAALLTSKLFDLSLGVGPDERPGFGAFFAYLVNPLWIVWRLPPRVPPAAVDARRLIVRAVIAGAGVAVVTLIFRVEWARWPFIVEHVVKAVALPVTAAAVCNAYAPLWRLCGGRGMDPMNAPLAARSPGDFWQRWNRPAQQFFHWYAFIPAGGRRRPFRATMAAFALSALGHEYIFCAAIGRVQGLQTAFFLINGLAVAATFGKRPPAGWRGLTWRIATLAFLIATSRLFFASVNEVFPIYAPR